MEYPEFLQQQLNKLLPVSNPMVAENVVKIVFKSLAVYLDQNQGKDVKIEGVGTFKLHKSARSENKSFKYYPSRPIKAVANGQKKELFEATDYFNPENVEQVGVHYKNLAKVLGDVLEPMLEEKLAKIQAEPRKIMPVSTEKINLSPVIQSVPEKINFSEKVENFGTQMTFDNVYNSKDDETAEVVVDSDFDVDNIL
jgi:nucleoid DNA-binding protein